jgi:hypothetical protein
MVIVNHRDVGFTVADVPANVLTPAFVSYPTTVLFMFVASGHLLRVPTGVGQVPEFDLAPIKATTQLVPVATCNVTAAIVAEVELPLCKAETVPIADTPL